MGVLLGGLSQEREISLKSGRAVAAALSRRGYDVVEIDAGADLPEQILSSGIDAAFIALHGRFGEDGTVQGLLEIMKIAYTGTGVAGSAIAIDKNLTKMIVAQGGVRTPPWATMDSGDKAKMRQSPLPLPVIVKPNREGSTIGMTIVREPARFEAACTEAARFDSRILVEQYVSGRELTVGIVNGRPLPVLEVVPKSGFYDFKAKYTPGMTEYIVPARISAAAAGELTRASEKVWSLMNLAGFARCDFILDGEERGWFLEVNTIPGMTELSLVPKAAAAVGLAFDELCDQILKGAALKA